MPTRMIVILSLLIFSCSVFGDVRAMQKRAKEMNSFGSIDGNWQGSYDIKTIRPSFMEGKQPKKLHVILEVESGEAKVSISLDKGELKKLMGEITLIENTAGWLVQYQAHNGVWIEKYIFSFSRDTETMAFSTYTRTVHNWYVEPGEDDKLEFFTAFGVGKVYRSDSR